MVKKSSKMKERLINQIFISEDKLQNEFKFDILLIIEELNKLPFEFYVSGGVICKFFLKEHSRYVNDIDIVTKCDLKEVERIFRQHFDVVTFVSNPASDPYFIERFICLVNLDGKTIQIDGMRLDFFNEIEPQIYKINDISFKGVPIDYLLATKIHAITIKIERPFKHLVDVYSASLIDPSLINKQEIKRYMKLYNDSENKVRKMFNKPEIPLSFSIENDKRFSGPEMLTTFQAGYNISKESLIEEVNKWLSSF